MGCSLGRQCARICFPVALERNRLSGLGVCVLRRSLECESDMHQIMNFNVNVDVG